tara:strand:- start:548 stop:1138 length:591 start_codon:yes stop_codon:yes gene_type:complete
METITINIDDYNKMNVELVELKKQNKKLKLFAKYDKFKCAKCRGHHTGCCNPTCDTCVAELKKENDKLEAANLELGEESEEIEQENVKLKNNNEIVGFMLMDDYVRKEIEQTIDEGINQYTFKLGTGFYREHILTYVKDIIIPHLTTYRDGDSQYSSYKNGLFYYNMDCMNPYEIESDNDGTYTFNRVESDEEDSD